jgi:hypothetical protein
MKKRVKTGSYPKIEAVLERAQRDAATQPEIVKALKEVARHKKSAARMTGKGVAEGRAALWELGDELGLALDRAKVAISRQEAKEVYGAAGGSKSGPKGVERFKALTREAKPYFRGGVAGGKVGDLYGVGAGESAALSTYTAADFRYINPAASFNEEWMKSNAAEYPEDMLGTHHDRVTEGGVHTAMMMEALGKLPVWRGIGYRGERMNQTRFDERFVKVGTSVTARQASIVEPNFYSVSMSVSTAKGFAGHSKDKTATISVLYLIKVGNARDVMSFSNASSEQEVLCPAGSTLTIESVEEMEAGPEGSKPMATAWYVVHLKQDHPLPGPDYHWLDQRERPVPPGAEPEFADISAAYTGPQRFDELEELGVSDRFDEVDELTADELATLQME